MREHTMVCRGCGEAFDMRELDQVVAHEHGGPALATGVRGDLLARANVHRNNEAMQTYVSLLRSAADVAGGPR